MIFRLDSDLSGTVSVQDVIDDKHMVNLECPSFQAFDKHVDHLITNVGVGPDDLVVIDTLTSGLLTTRMGKKLKDDIPLWDALDVFFKDPNYLTVYEMAAQGAMRKIRNLQARGVRLVIICHEKMQAVDIEERSKPSASQREKKLGPAVNPGMVETLLGLCSDVMRTTILDAPIINDANEVIVPSGTYMLTMRGGAECITKFQVPIKKAPDIKPLMANPTLPKLYAHLGKKPQTLLLYGAPGTGKSTLATSEGRE